MRNLVNRYFKTIGEFLPEKTIQPTVGVDFGSSAIKVVEAIRKDNQYEILNWSIEPMVHLDLSASIKQIFEKFNVVNKKITTSVSGKGTLIRYINMPRMSPEDLRASIDIEADKHFPFSKDQIYTDSFIIEKLNKSNKMQVLVAASKKEIIDQRIKLFSALNYKLDFVGINSLTLSNIIWQQYQENQKEKAEQEKSSSEAIAVLDFGHTISSLIILKDGFPYFTRDIFIGGQDLNKGISNILGIDTQVAENLKINPKERDQEVLNACETIISNLISEVRLSFDYFVTERDIPVKKLVLAGGSSALNGLLDLFNNNLDVTVEKWDPLKYFTISAQAEKTKIQDHAHRLGVALGLSLYQHD